MKNAVAKLTFPTLPDQAMLKRLATRPARSDAADRSLGHEIECQKNAGWLRNCLPGYYGGQGWATDYDAAVTCFEALRSLGQINLSVARLFEGHLNAVKLTALYGADECKQEVFGAVSQGALMGVWGADMQNRPVSVTETSSELTVTGGKRFASGLGLVKLAVITAQTANGVQLVVVPTQDAARMDESSWQVSGMQATRSGSYDFENFTVQPIQLLGAAGDYFREPFFEGGIWRYCAAHLGGAETLYRAMRDRLVQSGRASDAHQQRRIVDAALAVETTRLWILRAVNAVEIERADPGTAILALLAREITATNCRTVIHTVEAALGMEAFVEGSLIEQMRADLGMFLCQAAPDAKRTRAAEALVKHDMLPEDL